jgi:hypothetical protein
MTPERWRQLTTIFHAALAREGADRSAYLDRACGADPSLRADIDSLLASEGTLGPGAVSWPRLSPGTMFGLYRVDELIGVGGMGQVYRATDTRLGRTVALKLLLPDLSANPDFDARFEREARVLASLNHPNIAAIYGLEDTSPSTGTWKDRRSRNAWGPGTQALCPMRRFGSRSRSRSPSKPPTTKASSTAISSRPTSRSHRPAWSKCSTSELRGRLRLTLARPRPPAHAPE